MSKVKKQTFSKVKQTFDEKLQSAHECLDSIRYPVLFYREIPIEQFRHEELVKIIGLCFDAHNNLSTSYNIP